MSKNSPITAADGWFQGEDKRIEFDCVDSTGAPQNCSAFTLLFKLFTQQGSAGTLLFSKSGAAITTFNSAGTDDGVRVQISDTDTIAAIVVPATAGVELVAPGTYWYELWKTDEGDEQLLAYGDAVLQGSRRRQEVT